MTKTILLSIFFFYLSAFASYAEESVKIKILAVNPSPSQSLKTTVQQYLPPEVKPEDVLNGEGFEISYDGEKGAYLLKKEVELDPQETKTLEIQVRNVWIIEPEVIEEVRVQLSQSMNVLSKTKYKVTGKLLYDKANETLVQIEESREKPIGIMQRIELYRLQLRQLEDLKQNALSLEAMRRLEEESKSGVRQVSFFISAENPSDAEKKLTVRSELPRGVQDKDVLEKSDFEIVFDESKQIFVVTREDTLAPREVRRYQVSLRDIWYIPQAELNFIKTESGRLVVLFKKSPFEDFSVKQGDLILKTVQSIETSQAEVAGATEIQDRIRAHVLNTQRQKFAKTKLRELQDMLSEVALKPDEKEQDPIQIAIRKIMDMANHVLVAMGFQPSKSILWWLFLGIILFLTLLTVIFYSVWLKKLQSPGSSPGRPKSSTPTKPASSS